jgi:hypothetical protein
VSCPARPAPHASPRTPHSSPLAPHVSLLTPRPSHFGRHPSPLTLRPSPFAPRPSSLAPVPLGFKEQGLLVFSGRYTISSQRSRLGDKVVEAIQCPKSWAGEDLCYSTGSNVVDAERMLVDLQRQAEAIAGTTEEK